MGYNTRYTLTLEDANAPSGVEALSGFDPSALIAELRASNPDAACALSEGGSSQEPCHWYDAETELIAFSASYPQTLFTLSGEGESPADLWRMYFLGGGCQAVMAEITYPSFDRSKLK